VGAAKQFAATRESRSSTDPFYRALQLFIMDEEDEEERGQARFLGRFLGRKPRQQARLSPSPSQWAVLRGHEDKVSSADFCADGLRIISRSDDQTVRVWDARSRAELAVVPWHQSVVLSVAFSPGGERIVSGSGDRTVRIWDTRNGAELAVLRGHEGYVSSVAFSPDGERLVSGSFGETVRVWDARSGKCLEVIQGLRDVRAIAAGSQPCPLRRSAHRLEFAAERADGGNPVAWFPVALGRFATHPSGRIWAFTAGRNLYFITLEGGQEYTGTGASLP
jgi:WD40 repeat protein